MLVNPPFAATLVQTAPGIYQFGSMSGQQNQIISKATSDDFHRDLREVGVALLPCATSWSLAWALNPQRPSRRRRPGVLADAIGGEMDDDLIA